MLPLGDFLRLSLDSVEVLRVLARILSTILTILTILVKVILFYHRLSASNSCNSLSTLPSLSSNKCLSVATSGNSCRGNHENTEISIICHILTPRMSTLGSRIDDN